MGIYHHGNVRIKSTIIYSPKMDNSQFSFNPSRLYDKVITAPSGIQTRIIRQRFTPYFYNYQPTVGEYDDDMAFRGRTRNVLVDRQEFLREAASRGFRETYHDGYLRWLPANSTVVPVPYKSHGHEYLTIPYVPKKKGELVTSSFGRDYIILCIVTSRVEPGLSQALIREDARVLNAARENYEHFLKDKTAMSRRKTINDIVSPLMDDQNWEQAFITASGINENTFRALRTYLTRYLRVLTYIDVSQPEYFQTEDARKQAFMDLLLYLCVNHPTNIQTLTIIPRLVEMNHRSFPPIIFETITDEIIHYEGAIADTFDINGEKEASYKTVRNIAKYHSIRAGDSDKFRGCEYDKSIVLFQIYYMLRNILQRYDRSLIIGLNNKFRLPGSIVSKYHLGVADQYALKVFVSIVRTFPSNFFDIHAVLATEPVTLDFYNVYME